MVADSDPEVAERKIRGKEKVKGVRVEAPRAPRTHQIQPVTAITVMATLLGTVWHLSPVPGKTRSHQSNEKMTSLVEM